jgi:predicted nucleic acid-binding protein
LLIDRKPFDDAAATIFDWADRNEINVCTSALCFNNVHYIVRKVLGDQKTRMIIGELLEIIEVLSVTKSDILNAVLSDFNDFEDAIQHSVANSNSSVAYIITRNTKDFKKSKITVLDPDTFVKLNLNEL